MPFSNERPNDNPILAVTKTLLAMGFSVIPLREGSKRPAVAWREYQTRRPSEDELADWFGSGRFTNYGVVTGVVSGLFVLDFDNPALYHQFRQHYPQFTQTLTIRTKRGYHIYYRCDVEAMPDSQKLPELDVQAEGRYVVGSRSVVEGFEYQVEGSPRWPLYLKGKKLKQLTGWLEQYAAPESGLDAPGPYTVEGDDGEGELADAKNGVPTGSGEMDELQALSLYYKLAVERGRNNALFATACACRDAGWWQDKTLHVLGRVHVRQEAPEGHRGETDAQRYAEAERTIESAYSRPARKCKRAKREPASYVPNTVREKAMQSGMTAALRVLEGLLIVGGEAGMLVCYSDLKELLPEIGIGDYSIRQALKTVAPNGELLFRAVDFSPPHTPPDKHKANAAFDDTVTHTTNALLLTSQNQQKVSGRPKQYVEIPSNERLCKLFEVEAGGSDAVRAADVAGVKEYRSRLHRALVERRPGQYTRRWLAGRLGVSEQTTRRYDVFQGVKVFPMYHYTRLFWNNLEQFVPKDTDKLPDVPGGYFLHCEGKDYPVRRGLVEKLLSQGKVVHFAKREPNYYTVAENWRHAVPMSHAIEAKPPPAGLDAEAIAAYWAEVPLFMPAAGSEQVANVSKFRGVRVTVPENPRYERRSAPEMGESADEETVQRWVTRVYEWVNAQAGDDAAKRISRGAVARLAREYGLSHLKRGFAALQRRENIENPAGWLVTYMRSEWKWSRKHRWG